MTEDLWMIEYERVGEKIDSGELDRDGAIQRLQRLGLTASQAADHFDTATA